MTSNCKEVQNRCKHFTLNHVYCRPSDIAVAAVASNNIVTVNKDQNVFDSKKKMKAATIGGLNQKLVSQQKASIAMNQCLLYMYTNQVGGTSYLKEIS